MPNIHCKNDEYPLHIKMPTKDILPHIIATHIIPSLDQWSDRLSFLLTCRLFASLEHFFDPSINNNLAIRLASRNCYTAAVELLLKDPRVDPSVKINEAIRRAALYGNGAIVRLLLQDKRVNPSANMNQAIMSAAVRGHTGVVKLLLNDPRVAGTLSEEEFDLFMVPHCVGTPAYECVREHMRARASVCLANH